MTAINLNERAVLVSLSISQWTARKLDRKATAEVAVNNRASVRAIRANKDLLPGSKELKAVAEQTAFIRREVEANTLPWGASTRMLPTKNYMAFSAKFRALRTEWESRVEKFVDAYPDLARRARDDFTALGLLFDPKDYPAVAAVRRKFAISLDVTPIPEADFRVALSAEETARLEAELTRRVQDSAREAMADVWRRLHEQVSHMAERLGDPEAIFRDSLVENAARLCDLLPRLNVGDDPTLDAMVDEVRAKLVREPEILRSNPVARQDAAAAARAIMERMAGLM